MKTLKHNAGFFIAYPYASLMIEPGQRMFDHNSKDSQPRTMGIVHGLGQKRLDPARLHRVDIGLPAVASVTQIPFWSKARAAVCAGDSRKSVEQGYRLTSVQNVCRRRFDNQRTAVSINNYVPFAALYRNARVLKQSLKSSATSPSSPPSPSTKGWRTRRSSPPCTGRRTRPRRTGQRSHTDGRRDTRKRRESP